MAQQLYSFARAKGASPQRALEFVNAAYAESGLDPKNYYGRSAGKPFVPGKTAGGLFELLSSGYVRQAQARGGVLNARANTETIWPSYAAYWRSHPNARPGEAARDVERSGEGAAYYSGALGMLSGAVGKGAASSPSLVPQGAVASPSAAAPTSGLNPRAALASALIAANQASSSGRPPDYSQLSALVSQARMPQATTPPPALAGNTAPPKGGRLEELFYDPLGGIKRGQQIGAIGGHDDHVHVASNDPREMLAAMDQARRMGLRVSENPYVGQVHRVHVENSNHYRVIGRANGRSIGAAADVAGSPSQMAAYYRWAARNL